MFKAKDLPFISLLLELRPKPQKSKYSKKSVKKKQITYKDKDKCFLQLNNFISQ